MSVDPRRFPRRGKGDSRWRPGPRPPPAPWSGPRSASSAAPARTARPARGSVRAQRFRSCKARALNKARHRIAPKGWRSRSAATKARPGSTACSRCSARTVALAAESADPGRFRHRQGRPRPRPRLSCRAPAIRSQSTCRKRSPPEPKGEDIALDIVYEDDDIIVIDKPAGPRGASGRGPRERHAGQRADRPLRRQPFRHRRRQAGRASCTGSTRTRPG